ncbi:hypothetical protein HF289_18470, partial [Acidithiobacillus ferrooxidans]|nr:hypothetical protein [Acidithiobacillus ferrooxidans]
LLALQFAEPRLEFRDPRIHLGEASRFAFGPQKGFPMLEMTEAGLDAGNPLRRRE